MRKYFILIIMILALMTRSFSQNSLKKNSIYLELAGNGIIYSVNYDRIIPLSGQLKLAPRVGFEFLPSTKESGYGNIIIPIELNALLGKNSESKNHLELGVGLSFIQVDIEYLNSSSSKNQFAKVSTGRLGFRHQKPIGGFMYRAGIVLPFAQDNAAEIKQLKNNFFGGISLGYSF